MNKTDSYELLSSEVSEKRRHFKPKQGKSKSKESPYTRHLRTKIEPDGTLWFY